MKNRCLRFFIVLFLGLLTGCWWCQTESTGNASDSAELLKSGVYGTRTLQDLSATWITNRTIFEETYAALHKHQVESGKELPDIDFDSYGILLLEMGLKPTGGYTIHFDPLLSGVVDKKSVIHVVLKNPAEGMVVTQAVTSPFLLLKVRRSDIRSVSVLDQNGQSLFEHPIP